MRSLFVLLALLSLTGCRSVLAPTAAREAEPMRSARPVSPAYGAIGLERLKVIVTGDSITCIAGIALNGWTVEEFGGPGDVWDAGIEIDADLDGYCEFSTAYSTAAEGLCVFTYDTHVWDVVAWDVASPASLYVDEHELRFTLPLATYGLAPGQPFNFRFNLADSYHHYTWRNGSFRRGAATLGPAAEGIAEADPIDPMVVLQRR